MDRNWSNTTNGRDRAEEPLDALDQPSTEQPQISARRVVDLTTQIDFLDREIARYRELVEGERIRHATELAELQLEADTALDELRRQERRDTQALHDSYRSLLTDRQVEFDTALSAAAAASAAELAAERGRHQQILNREHTRRDVVLEASRRQTIDEINESHQRARAALELELTQATSAVDRLQAKLDGLRERADLAEQRAVRADKELAESKRNGERVESQHRIRIAEAEKQVALATSRLESERQRSAATLSELLERSASVARDADKARSTFAAEQAKADHAASTALLQAQSDYLELAKAADERASQAIEREMRLEAAIAELRARLADNDG